MTIAQPTLTTTRLVLRPFALSDAKDVQRLAGSPIIADTTANVPHPYLDGMAESWIESHAPALEQGTGVSWAITEGGALVGAIAIRLEAAHRRGEIGYWVTETRWNAGIATEAVRTVRDWAFAALDLNRIVAHHLSRNRASGRVMEKAGMRHEGHLRQHMIKNGRFEDIEHYAILRADPRP